MPDDDSKTRFRPAAGHERVGRPSRLGDVVADRIRSLVLEGELPPGTSLLQEELAERLGVSRTPLRQAFKQLEQEGLIVYTPSGTASVVELTNEEASELLDLRDIVDGFAARRLARVGIVRDVNARLSVLMEEMEAAVEADDKPQFLIANSDFHLTILRATGHTLLNQFASLIQLSSHAAFLEGSDHPARLKEALDEHRSIVAAIKSGDQDEAERVARQHIKNAYGFWYASVQPDQ